MFEIKFWKYILLYTLFNVLIYNSIFIKNLFINKIDYDIIILIIPILFIILNFINSLLFSEKFYKPLIYIFCICSCISMYFMSTYNTPITKDAIINLLETNPNEASKFFNLKMIPFGIFLCILPIVIFTKIITIKRSSFLEEIKYKLYFFIMFVFSIFILLSNGDRFYRIKCNKFLGDYIVPINYIRNSYRVFKNIINEKYNNKFINISDNAIINKKINITKKNLIILVIGESVRSKNFGLSGYKKDTTEFLNKYEKNIVNFSHTLSCGTSTFISVPCIFSHLSKDNYTILKGKQHENLLDIYKKLGFYVFWESNNGGCKGVCDRIDNKILKGSFNDEKLVDDLDSIINNIDKENSIIVLHQGGSHGPLYYKQYPENFEKFKPVCKKNINECKIEEIVNAYDNSIYYTSYILSRIIEILEKNSDEFNVAMMYVSDHGESLGEKNMFMHAGPYILTKNEQWLVPMLFWISKDFAKDFRINMSCMKNSTKMQTSVSQDNIFHSLLGLFNISSQYYNNKLDLFRNCRY